MRTINRIRFVNAEKSLIKDRWQFYNVLTELTSDKNASLQIEAIQCTRNYIGSLFNLECKYTTVFKNVPELIALNDIIRHWLVFPS